MRKFLFIAFALALGAQPYDHLYPIREGRKFGFISRDGKVVVAPKYDAVGTLAEGRIRVTLGSLSGYIDLSGKEVIAPAFDSAGEFRNGRAIVRNEANYALIDPSGKRLAAIPNRVLGEFHQGLLRVQVAGRTDESGKRLPTTYGFVDREGKFVIPPKFMPAGEFPDDPADLPVGGFEKEWCYFDRTGNCVIRISMGQPLRGADPFVNGRLRVKDGLTWGYKDASGKWAIPAKYNDAQDFKDGLASVQDGAKWIRIDTQGREVPEDKNPIRVEGPWSEGLALAYENDLRGWVDSKRKPAFPFRKYEAAYKFSDGMARVKIDGLFGYLDRNGKLVIPAQYWAAADFEKGLAFVQTKEGMAYIDTKGIVVWKSAGR